MSIASNLSFIENSAGAITTGTINAPSAPITFSINSTENARFDSNNYLLVGYTTSQGAYRLQVNGSLYASGSIIGNITGNVTGTVSTASNVAGGTAGQIHYQSAPGLTGFAGPGTAGQILTSAGTSAPVYVNTSSFMVGISLVANTATNIAGGTAGQVPYQTAAGQTSFIGPGTAGQILVSTGASAPAYTNTASVYVQNAVYVNNIIGGTAGQLVYQTAPNTTGFISTGSMYVQRAVQADSAAGSAGSVTNALTIGTGLSGSPSSTYNGSAAITISLNTATLMASAVQVSNSLTAGAGLTGTAFNGSAPQTWTLNTATLMATSVNLTGGAAGSLPYQSSANTTAMLGLGTAGYVLTAGASAPQWTAIGSLSAGTATNAVNIATVAQTASANYYPTFVSANNATSAYMAEYTTSSFYINPSTGAVTHSGTGGVNFAQPTPINFANGQYIKDNGAGGFIQYSGAAFQLVATNGITMGTSAYAQQSGATLSVNGGAYINGTVTATNFVGNISGSATGSAGSAGYTGNINATANTNVFEYIVGVSASGSTTAAATVATSVPVGFNASTGLVGLGTTTPNSKLDVRFAALSTSTQLNHILLQSLADGANNQLGARTGITFNNRTVDYVASGGLSTAGVYGVSTDNNVYARQLGLVFYTSALDAAATEKLRITSAGALAFGGAANYGSSGQILQSNGDAAPTWVNASGITSGATSLTNTYVGFGSASNLLTGSANLTWNGTTLYINGRLQNAGGLKTYSVSTGGQGNVNAIYEIMKISRDSVNWSTNTSYEITVYSSYYTSGGYTKWLLTYGYGDTGTLVCTYASGGGKMRVYLGSEVTVNANCQYKPVFLDIPPYMQASIEVRYNTTEVGAVGSINSSGQVFFSAIMTASGGTGAFYSGDIHLVPSGGNVGIGTTNPAYKLQVVGANTTGTPLAQFNATGTGAFQRGVQLFNTALAAGESIMYSVGTADSSRQMGQMYYYYAGSNSTSNRLSFGLHSVDDVINILGSGNVMIGTTADNGGKLGVSGEIRATNEITAYYSDRRLKENVNPITNAVDKILKLNGITYNPNDLAESFGFDKTQEIVGLFADEVEEVLPQAVRPAPFDQTAEGVSKSGENYKTIQYEKLVPLLIEAIKEQNTIIESQQAKIDRLMKHLGLED